MVSNFTLSSVYLIFKNKRLKMSSATYQLCENAADYSQLWPGIYHRNLWLRS